MMDTDELRDRLETLQRDNPRGYGYLSRYWEAAMQGLDNTARNYASVTQIHDNIADPQVSTRTLGQTLTILTKLGVISVHTHRSNATIYDLTTYDPNILDSVGRIMDTC